MTEPETQPRPPAIINAVIRDAIIGLDPGSSSLLLEIVLDVSEKISAMRYAVTGLYTLEPLKTRQDNGNLAGHTIYRLLQVSGATRLAEAIGRTVRLRVRGNEILAIGHPVREVWWAPVAEGQQIEARGAVKMIEAAEAERVTEAERLGALFAEDGTATMDSAVAEPAAQPDPKQGPICQPTSIDELWEAGPQAHMPPSVFNRLAEKVQISEDCPDPAKGIPGVDYDVTPARAAEELPS